MYLLSITMGVAIALVAWGTVCAQTSKRYIIVFDGIAAADSFKRSARISAAGETAEIRPLDSVMADPAKSPLIIIVDDRSPRTNDKIVSVMADDLAVDILRQQADVSYVVEDETFIPLLDRSSKVVGSDVAAQAGFVGTGYSIAILDTGIDASHPFLRGRVVLEACFSFGDGTTKTRSTCPSGSPTQIGAGSAMPPSPTVPQSYHGTHVAGIAAGFGGRIARGRLEGIARGANVVSIQVFHLLDSPLGCFPETTPCLRSNTESQVRALEFVREVAEEYKIVSVNLSLGAYPARKNCDDSGFKTLFDQMSEEGIAVVVASGNSGDSTGVTLPACVSTAIAVGAVDTSDRVQRYSNASDDLDLLAPGHLVTSSTPGGGFIGDSGTSMAAPHVAGAIAVLKSYSPTASVTAMVDALRRSGAMITDPRIGTQFSRIDIWRAASLVAGSRHDGKPLQHSAR